MPDTRALTAAVSQFRIAAQMMTTQLTRMTIETYGAAGGLGVANVALADFGKQVVSLTGVMPPLTDALGQTQTAFVELDRTLHQMDGIQQAQNGLMALDLEATLVQETLDNFLSPALTDAVAGFTRTGTAADTFARTADEVLTRVSQAARIALDELARVVNLVPASITFRSEAGAGAQSSAAAEAGVFGRLFVPQQPTAPVQCCGGGGEGPGGVSGWIRNAREGTYEVYQKIASILGLMGSVADVWEAVGPESFARLIPKRVRDRIPGLDKLLSATGQRAAVLAAGAIGVAMEFGVDPGEPEQGGSSGSGGRTQPGPQAPAAPTPPSELAGHAYGAAAASALAFGSSSVSVTIATSPDATRQFNEVLRRSFELPAPAPITRGRPIPRNEAAITLRAARQQQGRLTGRAMGEDRTGDISAQTFGELRNFHSAMIQAAAEAPERFKQSYEDIVQDLERQFPALKPPELMPVPAVQQGGISLRPIGASTRLEQPAPPPLRGLAGLLDQLYKALGQAGTWFGNKVARGAAALDDRIGGAGSRFLDFVRSAAVKGVDLARGAAGAVGRVAAGVPGQANTILSRMPVIGRLYRNAPEMAAKIPGWGGANEIAGQQVKSSGQAFQGLLSSFTPLGVVATLLQGVFEGLAPLIESLKEPLRIVGTILGAALAPILKALFPLFKQIAIAATWVGQIFFTVAGGIAKVVGSLIKGLGKLIDKIPGMSDMGLVKAGQNMIDLGKGFTESAQAMKEGREQIKELEFGETAEAAQQANEAMRNVPEGFKIAVARFQAAAPAAVTPPTGIGTASVPVGHAGTPAPVVENNPVTIQQVHIVSDNPEKIWHQLRDVMEREGLRHSGNPMAFAM